MSSVPLGLTNARPEGTPASETSIKEVIQRLMYLNCLLATFCYT